MDNVIEALGKGRNKRSQVKKGRGFEDIKNFVKKHKGKIAAALGTLGTIGAIAALASTDRKSKGQQNYPSLPEPFTEESKQPYSQHEPALEPFYNPFLVKDVRPGTRSRASSTESIGLGKSGGGLKEVKDFIKKHKGKIAAVAGALGTIASIAALASMSGKPKNPSAVPQGIALSQEHKDYLERLSKIETDESKFNIRKPIVRRYSDEFKLPPLEPIVERRSDSSKIPEPVIMPPFADMPPLEDIPLPRTPSIQSRRPSTSLLIPPPEPIRRPIPQAVPIKPKRPFNIIEVLDPKPKQDKRSPPFTARPPPRPEKKGDGKKNKNKKNSILKQVMNYKIKNNTTLKEAWKAIRGY